MADNLIKTMDNAAFFDGVTWLNQTNWQKYFHKSLPTGVLVDGAFELNSNGYTIKDNLDITQTENVLIVGPGAVMANGLYGELTSQIEIPHVTQEERTKFICVQFDDENSNAKIIEKVDIVFQRSLNLTSVIQNLVTDESFLCTRNDIIFEVPLAFEYYSNGLKILDLRRIVYAPSGKKRNLTLSTHHTSTTPQAGILRGNSYVQLFGGTTYYIPITSQDTQSQFSIYPMPSNSNEDITLLLTNTTSETKNFILRNSSNGTEIGYEWVSSWSSNANGVVNQISPASSVILILSPVQVTTGVVNYAVITKAVGLEGEFNPELYYDKSDIDNLLNLKANTSNVNTQLAKKEDISKLKALAYLDTVNYVTQVTNKPADVASDSKYYARRNQAWAVLGAMANAADVSSNNVYYARRNQAWAALGAMANAADVGTNNTYYARRNNAWVALSETTFYVSSSGSSSNEGTEAKPFDKISTAVNKAPFGCTTKIVIIGSSAPADNFTIPFGKKIVISPKINTGYLSLTSSNSNNPWCTINGGELSFEDGNFTVTGNIQVLNNGLLLVRCTKNVNPAPSGGSGSESFTITKGIYALWGGKVILIRQAGDIVVGADNYNVGITAERGAEVIIYTNNENNLKINANLAIKADDAGFVRTTKFTGNFTSVATAYRGGFVVANTKSSIGGTIANFS